MSISRAIPPHSVCQGLSSNWSLMFEIVPEFTATWFFSLKHIWETSVVDLYCLDVSDFLPVACVNDRMKSEWILRVM
jgi:hypothetical protein